MWRRHFRGCVVSSWTFLSIKLHDLVVLCGSRCASCAPQLDHPRWYSNSVDRRFGQTGLSGRLVLYLVPTMRRGFLLDSKKAKPKHSSEAPSAETTIVPAVATLQSFKVTPKPPSHPSIRHVGCFRRSSRSLSLNSIPASHQMCRLCLRFSVDLHLAGRQSRRSSIETFRSDTGKSSFGYQMVFNSTRMSRREKRVPNTLSLPRRKSR